jgi:hypothetical protein
VVRLGVHAIIQGTAAKVQSDLEADFRAFRGRTVTPEIRLEAPRPQAP